MPNSDSAAYGSPLAGADRSPIQGPAPIRLQEDTGKAQLLLRGKPGKALAGEISALGLALPAKPLESSAAGDKAIRWLSPDAWLLTLPQKGMEAAEAALRAKLGADCALVNIGSGQTLLVLGGDKAEELLRKSSPYDFHPSAFPIGKVVTTAFAQTEAIVRRRDDAEFELIVRRSYALYIWRWLRDAAAEYGLTCPAPQ